MNITRIPPKNESVIICFGCKFYKMFRYRPLTISSYPRRIRRVFGIWPDEEHGWLYRYVGSLRPERVDPWIWHCENRLRTKFDARRSGSPLLEQCRSRPPVVRVSGRPCNTSWGRRSRNGTRLAPMTFRGPEILIRSYRRRVPKLKKRKRINPRCYVFFHGIFYLWNRRVIRDW